MIEVNKGIKPITQEYFTSYGGSGGYSNNYYKYTIAPEKVLSDLKKNNLPFNTLLDVGCASGELVKDFRDLGVRSYGIELNEDIMQESPVPEYCVLMDMRDLSTIKPDTFDVIYTNSMMYLFPQEILGVLKEFKRIGNTTYLCVPFLNDYASEDKNRTFLGNRTWWDGQFKEAGFLKVSDSVFTRAQLVSSK